MAFNEQEKQLIIYGKSQGKSDQEITNAIARYRAGITTQQPEPIEQKGISMPSLDFLRPVRMTQEIESEKRQTLRPEIVQQEKTKEALSVGAIPLAGDPLDFYKNNEKYFGVPLGEVGGLARTAVRRLGGAVAESAPVQAVKTVAENIGEAARTPASGVGQFVSELGERIPRFFGRLRESAEQSAVRAERIKTATPAVQEAIKVNLDDRIINTIEQARTNADTATLKAYKEMTDIAESSTARKGGTLELTQRPEIVAGRAAEQQYDLIEAQRKAIGKQIGEAVDKLSETVKIPVLKPIFQMEEVLSQNGISVGQKGKLSFTGSRFTPAERTRIQQLYDLAIEGGGTQTPRQIYGKDQLFSKLQREARFEGVGDIIVETPQGNSSLFRVFRDIYTNTLDEVSPDDIRALNKQYRNIITLIDDIEGSIFKSGNFEGAKNVSGAEFAKTNLRRLLSDSQSAAIYQAIAKEMDTMARQLGYEGANPEQLITFATALRDVYAETIPKTSITGIIGGIRGALEKTLEIGAPSSTDRQRALRALLDEALNTKR